jgi:hypothetical protein
MQVIDLEIWMNLCVLSHPEYENLVFGMLYVCVCVCIYLYIYGLICVLLVRKWLGLFFIFCIQALIQYTRVYQKVSGLAL